MPPPNKRTPSRRPRPKQQIDQINPNRIFHALDTLTPLRILLNKHLAKNPKDHKPQQKQHGIPPRKPPALDEREHHGDGGEGGEAADHDGVDPFAVGVFVGQARVVEVVAVETADCEGEDELECAEYETRDCGAGEWEHCGGSRGDGFFALHGGSEAHFEDGD